MNWPTKQLEELVDFFSGNAWKAQHFCDEPNGMPIIRIQNVNAEHEKEFKYWPHSFDERFLINQGDIILTLSGSFRVAVWSGPKALLNQRIVKLTPRQGIEPSWLLHVIQFLIKDIEHLGRHALINNVPLSALRQLKVSLPPLDEQRRIAAILDQADALLRKRRKAIETIRQLRRSVFDQLFGDPDKNPKNWPVSPISALTESTQYGTSSKAGNEGQFPILRMGNMTYAGDWKLDDLKYIDLVEKDLEKFTVKDGDILFNRTNSPDLVGKSAVFKEHRIYAFAGYLVRLRLNHLAHPEYVSAYLNSTHGKATLRGMCKSIIGMANINAKELTTIQLLVPPIELQIKFAQTIDESRAAERIHRSSLNQLDNLFAVIQHRAFRGEL